MVQIQISGPAHSKKGYMMVEIARVLRECGCEVTMIGEETHLIEKQNLNHEQVEQNLTGQRVHITELKTAF